MNRTFSKTVKMPLDLVEKIEKAVDDKKFKNESDAIRGYLQIGIWVDSIKHSIKNPSFIKKIEELQQGNTIFDWLFGLEENQLNAILEGIKLVKEQQSPHLQN